MSTDNQESENEFVQHTEEAYTMLESEDDSSIVSFIHTMNSGTTSTESNKIRGPSLDIILDTGSTYSVFNSKKCS